MLRTRWLQVPDTCNEEVVRMVVSEAPERIRELIEMGVDFDKKPDGTLDMANGKEVMPSTGYFIIRILQAPPLRRC